METVQRRSSIDYAKLHRNNSIDDQWKQFILSIKLKNTK